MPDVGEAMYLVEYWNDLGLFVDGQMGAGPLSAQEIQAWRVGTQMELSAWEFRVLMQMSRAYLGMKQAGSEPECAPPYGNPANEFDRAKVSKKIGDAFKSLLMARKS